MVQQQVGVTKLGQSGFRFKFGATVVYIDPYLSDSVAELEGPDMARMLPAACSPDTIRDAEWVLATHIHQDHADPETLVPLGHASPQCSYICPPEVAELLESRGVVAERIHGAREEWVELSAAVRVHAVPAAHTAIERDAEGNSRFLGFVFQSYGRLIYHAGDTSPHEEIVSILNKMGPIDVAFLPVNECNYYRDRRGIVGNLSLREAFAFAVEIGAQKVVPMHWDMFRPNMVHREEIELFYQLEGPSFEMDLDPTWV